MLRSRTLSILLALVSAGGFQLSWAAPPDAENAGGVQNQRLELRPFSGARACEDLQSYLAQAYTTQFLTRFSCRGFAPCPLFLDGPVATNPVARAPERVSDTNVQEAGVDEADIVKTDRAGHFYILTGRRLVVTDAFPPEHIEQRAQAVLDLSAGNGEFSASGSFLDEERHRLVVMGSRYQDDGSSRAVSLVIDVQQALAPRIVSEVSLDGYAMDARRIGDRIHRVVHYDIPFPPSIDSDAGLQHQREAYFRAQDQGRDLAAARIRRDIASRISQLTAEADVQTVLPELRSAAATERLTCSDVARAGVSSGTGLAVLESFTTDGSQHGARAFFNDGGTLYASPTSLYLTDSSANWRSLLAIPAEETVIYRFAATDDGNLQYAGLGRVPGSLIGSYAMSEYDGHLRVASTTSGFNGFSPENNSSTNHLAVMALQADGLPQVGTVATYASGEFIRGVRFLGTRGYVVTFKQVDPLFAFDLSRPEQPRLMSELTLPGFSSYLFPLDQDHLLTIGRGGNDEQLNGAVSIQLFDVHDAARVRKLAEIQPSAGDQTYSYSTAEYDPHAFSYFATDAGKSTAGTLSVPLRVNDSRGQSFTGFLVVGVDTDARDPLQELGRVDHSQAFSDPGCAAQAANGIPCFSAEPERSIYAADDGGRYLYTLSSAGLLASDADAPARTLGRVVLPRDDAACCFRILESGTHPR